MNLNNLQNILSMVIQREENFLRAFETLTSAPSSGLRQGQTQKKYARPYCCRSIDFMSHVDDVECCDFSLNDNLKVSMLILS